MKTLKKLSSSSVRRKRTVFMASTALLSCDESTGTDPKKLCRDVDDHINDFDKENNLD